MDTYSARQILLRNISSPLVAVFRCSSSRVFAQAGTGGITGTVVNTSGSVVPGAAVSGDVVRALAAVASDIRT
jgi:hypothetical protein